MSAYICEDSHINALACYAVENQLWSPTIPDLNTPDQELLGRILHAENAKSVAYRYNEEPDDSYEFHFVETLMNQPIQLIKAANCYRYQACEHPGWDGSVADKVTQAIVTNAIADLPGYSEAAWGWENKPGPQPVRIM